MLQAEAGDLPGCRYAAAQGQPIDVMLARLVMQLLTISQPWQYPSTYDNVSCLCNAQKNTLHLWQTVSCPIL
jgi:hypothetical protein